MTYDNLPDDYNEPCRYYKSGMYATTVIIDILGFDANNQASAQKKIFPTRIFKNGVDFSNGNPYNLTFDVPAKGAFALRVQVFGEVGGCGCDSQSKPFWEQVWRYEENRKQHYLYISFPAFQACV